jgi:hypothetical protein
MAMGTVFEYFRILKRRTTNVCEEEVVVVGGRKEERKRWRASGVWGVEGRLRSV